MPWYFGGSLELKPGAEIAVPDDGLVLGRGIGADVRVASNGVARAHAKVEPGEDGESLVARDLGSTNGTTSSHGEGAVHHLRPGDRLTLAGRFDFEVVVIEQGG